MLKSKIHRAIVTDANIGYEGSISIDPDLLEQTYILEYEQVHIYNVTNGQRFVTYAIKGNKGDICVNGAAAKLVNIGDVIIIASYGSLEYNDVMKGYKPIVTYCDNKGE